MEKNELEKKIIRSPSERSTFEAEPIRFTSLAKHESCRSVRHRLVGADLIFF